MSVECYPWHFLVMIGALVGRALRAECINTWADADQTHQNSKNLISPNLKRTAKWHILESVTCAQYIAWKTWRTLLDMLLRAEAELSHGIAKVQ